MKNCSVKVIAECAERGQRKQMHLIFEMIASMDAKESDKNGSKTEKRNRNEENRRQIIDLIADNGISDVKSISKAISIIFSLLKVT